jgi:hypothetical protein
MKCKYYDEYNYEEKCQCDGEISILSDVELSEVIPELTDKLLSEIIRLTVKSVRNLIEWQEEFTVHDEDCLIDSIKGDIKRGTISS